MGKAYSGIGLPATEYLGAGAVYFNWGLSSEALVGVTKGGAEFTDNAEFREREADGDYAPVKGHRNLTKIMPQLTVPALKLSTANLVKFAAGMIEDSVTTPGETRLYRTIDLSSSYIENVAFVGASRQGKLMVIVLKNALGDGPLAIPATAKEEEIVVSVLWTAHVDGTFDPSDKLTYPYYIIKDTSQVTFTVEATATPIEDAEIIFDGQFGLTDVLGVAVFTGDKGTGFTWTVTADTFVTQSGTVDITADTTAVAVEMVPV
jgi:hypothetical protein